MMATMNEAYAPAPHCLLKFCKAPDRRPRAEETKSGSSQQRGDGLPARAPAWPNNALRLEVEGCAGLECVCKQPWNQQPAFELMSAESMARERRVETMDECAKTRW